MISEVQEAVQKTIRDINSNFFNVARKLNVDQIESLRFAKELIEAILMPGWGE